MNTEEQTKYEWISVRLSELAVAERGVSTSQVALVMRAKLVAHIKSVFPDMTPALNDLADDPAVVISGMMQAAGPGLWKQLHLRAETVVKDAAAENAWLAKFALELPCGSCRGFYRGYLRSNPPNFSDYQGWMIGLHNAVNKKMTKPEMPVAQARAIIAGWVNNQ